MLTSRPRLAAPAGGGPASYLKTAEKRRVWRSARPGVNIWVPCCPEPVVRARVVVSGPL